MSMGVLIFLSIIMPFIIHAEQYQIIDLGTDGGTESKAYYINNYGNIVGSIRKDEFHAFLWTKETGMIDLNELWEGHASVATGINDLGQIIGWRTKVGQPNDAVVWIPPSTLEVLPVPDGYTKCIPHFINNLEEVVGICFRDPEPYHGFLWKADREIVDLNPLVESYMEAEAINDNSLVVGSSGNAFLWTEEDGMQGIGGLPNGTSGVAYAINNQGQIVGMTHFDAALGLGYTQRATLWEDDQIIEIGSIGGKNSQALGINNDGRIVGVARTPDDYWHSFIWTYEDGFEDLHNLIVNIEEWADTRAVAINDQGEIIGFGTVNGEEHAFLLTPIPIDTDGDGIPDDEDACPYSDLSETVTIDDCDSGVENVLFDDGCTISDLICECAEDAKNHGQFDNRVSHMLNDLKKDGIISGEEKGAIQNCAEGADIP